MGLGFRVSGFVHFKLEGFAQCFGVRVWELWIEFRALKIKGSGFEVKGFRGRGAWSFRVGGLGLRPPATHPSMPGKVQRRPCPCLGLRV